MGPIQSLARGERPNDDDARSCSPCWLAPSLGHTLGRATRAYFHDFIIDAIRYNTASSLDRVYTGCVQDFHPTIACFPQENVTGRDLIPTLKQERKDPPIFFSYRYPN